MGTQLLRNCFSWNLSWILKLWQKKLVAFSAARRVFFDMGPKWDAERTNARANCSKGLEARARSRNQVVKALSKLTHRRGKLWVLPSDTIDQPKWGKLWSKFFSHLITFQSQSVYARTHRLEFLRRLKPSLKNKSPKTDHSWLPSQAKSETHTYTHSGSSYIARVTVSLKATFEEGSLWES